MAMSNRRLTTNQVLNLIEGAEMVAQATGLSVSEVVTIVLSEPVVQEEKQPDEGERLRPAS